MPLNNLTEAEWDWARQQCESGALTRAGVAKHFGIYASTVNRHAIAFSWKLPVMTPKINRDISEVSKSDSTVVKFDSTFGTTIQKREPAESMVVFKTDQKPVNVLRESVKEISSVAETNKDDEDDEDDEDTKERDAVLATHKAIWKEAREKVVIALESVDPAEVKLLKDIAMTFKYIQSGERLAYGLKDQTDFPVMNQRYNVSWEGESNE